MDVIGVVVAAVFAISLLTILFDLDRDTNFWLGVNALSGVALLVVVCLGAIVHVN